MLLCAAGVYSDRIEIRIIDFLLLFSFISLYVLNDDHNHIFRAPFPWIVMLLLMYTFSHYDILFSQWSVYFYYVINTL